MDIDNDFDFYLQFAKSLVLNLPQLKDRLLAAAWVKKLMDSSSPLSLRTDYLKLLLFVLQRKKLLGIFCADPKDIEGDQLPSLPDADVLAVARKLVGDERAADEQISTYPAVMADHSADLMEYVAVQEIPKFGVHAYYAFSKHPLCTWDGIGDAILPTVTNSMMKVTEIPKPTYLEAPPIGGGGKMPTGPKFTPTKGTIQLLGTIETIHKPLERPPPTWGSNLLEIKQLLSERNDLMSSDDEDREGNTEFLDELNQIDAHLSICERLISDINKPSPPEREPTVDRVLKEAFDVIGQEEAPPTTNSRSVSAPTGTNSAPSSKPRPVQRKEKPRPLGNPLVSPEARKIYADANMLHLIEPKGGATVEVRPKVEDEAEMVEDDEDFCFTTDDLPLTKSRDEIRTISTGYMESLRASAAISGRHPVTLPRPIPSPRRPHTTPATPKRPPKCHTPKSAVPIVQDIETPPPPAANNPEIEPDPQSRPYRSEEVFGNMQIIENRTPPPPPACNRHPQPTPYVYNNTTTNQYVTNMTNRYMKYDQPPQPVAAPLEQPPPPPPEPKEIQPNFFEQFSGHPEHFKCCNLEDENRGEQCQESTVEELAEYVEYGGGGGAESAVSEHHRHMRQKTIRHRFDFDPLKQEPKWRMTEQVEAVDQAVLPEPAPEITMKRPPPRSQMPQDTFHRETVTRYCPPPPNQQQIKREELPMRTPPNEQLIYSTPIQTLDTPPTTSRPQYMERTRHPIENHECAMHPPPQGPRPQYMERSRRPIDNHQCPRDSPPSGPHPQYCAPPEQMDFQQNRRPINNHQCAVAPPSSRPEPPQKRVISNVPEPFIVPGRRTVPQWEPSPRLRKALESAQYVRKEPTGVVPRNGGGGGQQQSYPSYYCRHRNPPPYSEYDDEYDETTPTGPSRDDGFEVLRRPAPRLPPPPPLQYNEDSTEECYNDDSDIEPPPPRAQYQAVKCPYAHDRRHMTDDRLTSDVQRRPIVDDEMVEENEVITYDRLGNIVNRELKEIVSMMDNRGGGPGRGDRLPDPMKRYEFREEVDPSTGHVIKTERREHYPRSMAESQANGRRAMTCVRQPQQRQRQPQYDSYNMMDDRMRQNQYYQGHGGGPYPVRVREEITDTYEDLPNEDVYRRYGGRACAHHH